MRVHIGSHKFSVQQEFGKLAIELVLPDASWPKVVDLNNSVYHLDKQFVFCQYAKHGGNIRLIFKYSEQDADSKLKMGLADISLPQLKHALQRLPSSAVRLFSF